MPRDYSNGELPSKSDMEEDLHYKLQEMGYTKVVNNIKELETAILNINKIKINFSFNNNFALQKLKKIMEKNG